MGAVRKMGFTSLFALHSSGRPSSRASLPNLIWKLPPVRGRLIVKGQPSPLEVL